MRWTMFALLLVHTVHDAFSLVSLAIALDHGAYSQDPVGSCSLCLAWIGRFEAWENQKSLFLSCKTIGQQEWAGASCENSLETWAPESLDCETVSKIYIASYSITQKSLGCLRQLWYQIILKFFTVCLLLSLASVLCGWRCLAKWNSWGLTDATTEDCSFIFFSHNPYGSDMIGTPQTHDSEQTLGKWLDPVGSDLINRSISGWIHNSVVPLGSG